MKEKTKRKGIITKLAIGTLAAGMAFAAPVAPAVMSGAGTVFAATADTIGSETVPKHINLNTYYSNRTNSSTYPRDWYYFDSDGNRSSDEYIIEITLAQDAKWTDVYLYKWIQRENRMESVANFELSPTDGQTQMRYYLDKNSKYVVKIQPDFSSTRYLNYKFKVIHKADSGSQTALVKKYNGKWIYFGKNGSPDYSFTGLAKTTGGAWVHVTRGVFDTSYTGLSKSATGKWYYVKKGRYDTSFSGLAKAPSGKWYHVTKGKYKPNYTGLSKAASGKWYYVKDGKYTKYTGSVRGASGKWYYVRDGKVV